MISRLRLDRLRASHLATGALAWQLVLSAGLPRNRGRRSRRRRPAPSAGNHGRERQAGRLGPGVPAAPRACHPERQQRPVCARASTRRESDRSSAHARIPPRLGDREVGPGQTATQDFALIRNPLQLQTMVVTGTQTPRMNLDASVAVTTLTSEEVQSAAPRSTTEMLRYVPGFTRVESSGGEVNENITMRGILGVEYVAFFEDGLPVYPTMHTFFMNADNLFRFDENIDRMEVVRGGSSPLFGSNTPGAIVNFINKTGGDIFAGSMRASAATEGLARYDLNINGPFGDDWRFNAGGFYRYDHGVRDPGYPGIRGGQLKANITRLLNNGYIRFSVKYIDDRNEFITPLPFTNAADPQFVQGFGDYGSMITNEGVDITVPTPNGPLQLPLDNGLRTKSTWFTGDVGLDLSKDWHLQNTAQVMQNDQEWNAMPSGGLFSAQDFITAPKNQGGLGLPAGTTGQYFFTNQSTPRVSRCPSTPRTSW